MRFFSSDVGHAAACAVWLGAAWCVGAFGCSPDSRPAYDPCLGCAVCVNEIGCGAACETDEACTPGHRCIPYAGSFYCDPLCDSMRCAELGRLACGGTGTVDECVPVACSPSIACEDSSDICDAANRCTARDGTCSVDAECPAWPLGVEVLAQSSCDGSHCRLTARPPMFTVDDEHMTIEVLQPAAGTRRVFASRTDIEFRWGASSNTQFVLVLERLPLSPADLADVAIWGAVARPGVGSMRWDGGHDIVAREWQSGTPSDPPMDRTLLFVVQAVDTTDLVGLSALEPFGVGATEPWSLPLDGCAERPCTSPLLPLLCVAGACRALCASNEDCRAAGGGTCRDPVDGIRVCR